MMSIYRPSPQYETNRMSDHVADVLATRKINEVDKDAPTACPICGEEVNMIVAEKAATVCQCSRRKIYRWIEEGDLHFSEGPDGEVLVCGRSLSQKMDELESTTDKLSGAHAAVTS